MAGIYIEQQEGLRLIAGVGINPTLALGLSIPPEGEETAIVLPPADSGIGFITGRAIAGADGVRGLIVVLDVAARPNGLTDRQNEALRLLSRQAGFILAQAQLAKAAALYREAFQSAEIDLVLIDVGKDGSIRLEESNHTHLTHLGLTREEFVGRTPEEALGPTVAVLARAKYVQVIESRQKVEYEAVVPFPHGERVRHSTMTPLFDESGRVAKILLTSLDLTERRRAESQLRQAQKIQSLGQLTGGVAHDFNNLLTIVLGGLDLIEAQLPNLPPCAATTRIVRARDMALQGVQRAATLTQRLLAFARRQPLMPQPIDANKLVSELSDMLRRTLGELVTLETVLAEGLWQTEADGHQLENAVLNLALNARDAMPDGGRLTIETANARLDPGYVDHLSEPVRAGDYVLITVSDTGYGMDQATAERAFEPFFTTKDSGTGTGLGLSQVYGFVRQSGGHVRIYSEPGEGTAVKIYLPRLADAAQASWPEQVVSTRAVVPTGGETVLLVEDEPALCAYTTDVLRNLGYRVLHAADGHAALRLLEAQAQIDLLFTDVVLPGGLNGPQLADEAIRRRPELKVLFTTGYSRHAIVSDGRLSRGVQMLQKPFSYAELAGTVRRVLDGSC